MQICSASNTGDSIGRKSARIELNNVTTGLKFSCRGSNYSISKSIKNKNRNHEIKYSDLTLLRGIKPFLLADTIENEVSILDNFIQYHNNLFDIQYINDDSGLRQNIILNKKPVGEGKLNLHYTIKGNVFPQLIDNRILFYQSDNKKNAILQLTDFNVWDVFGKKIPAQFQLSYSNKGEPILIMEIDDINATYPLFIDPLNTDPVWKKEGEYSGFRFGERAEIVGDVNGDNFDDIMVSAPEFSYPTSDEGIVYLYLGSASGPSTSPDWSYHGDQFYGVFGRCISGGGDINGDGYDDVIIGTPKYSINVAADGVAFLFYGGPDGLSELPEWYATSSIIDSRFGFSINSDGDFNNDGFSDIIIGMSMENDDLYYFEAERKVFIYYGSPDGPQWEADVVLSAPDSNIYYGQSITSANINGDDYDDVIISGSNYRPGPASPSMLVYLGSAAGISGEVYQDYFNSKSIQLVENAGDVNNDGYEDIIALREYPVLFTGSATGLSEQPIWTFVTTTWPGSQCLEGVGDINLDGYDDVMIGSSYYAGHIGSESSTFLLFFGREAGLSDFPVWWNYLSGSAGSENNSISVSGKGDINNDNYPDILTGLASTETASGIVGSVSLFQGGKMAYDIIYEPDTTLQGFTGSLVFGSGTTPLGDIDMDGYDDLAIGAEAYDDEFSTEGFIKIYKGSATGLSPIADLTIEGDYYSAHLGKSVCAPGDITNDGYDDLLAQANNYLGALPSSGRIYLFSGGPDGFDSIPDFSYSGTFTDGNFGDQIKKIGDVNGDGINDFITNEPGYDGGQTDEGRILVYYGAAPYPSATPSWTFENNIIYSELGNISGYGDINNDGYDDIIAATVNFITGSEGGRAYIFLGSASGLPATPSWVKSGTQSAEYYGQNIKIIPDINNDEFDDVIISTSEYDGIFDKSGKIEIYFGSPLGISMTPNILMEGDSIIHGIGAIVNSIGDYNGDGYNDIIYGVPSQYDFISAYSFPINTKYFIVNGTATGLMEDPSYLTNPYDLCSDGALGAEYAGDLNGDGIDDFFISAPRANLRIFQGTGIVYPMDFLDRGIVYIYYGQGSTCSSIASATLTASTATTLTLSWVISDAEQYDIRYRKTGTTLWNYLSTATTPLTITGLIACTNYEIQIQSVCNSGAAVWSTTQIFTTSGCVVCAIPIGLTSTIISPVKVNVSWTAVAGATKYKIYYRELGTAAWTTINSASNSKNISGLSPGTTYQWKLKTICGALSSTFTSIQTFTTPLKLDGTDEDLQLDVFPNPNNGSFVLNINNFNISESDIEIFSADGKEILKWKMEFPTGNISIPIEINAANGIYLIRIVTSEKVYTKKFILNN